MMDEKSLQGLPAHQLALPTGTRPPVRPDSADSARRHRLTALGAALLVAVLPAGCATGGSGSATATGSASTSAESTSPASAPSPTEAPAGTQWAEATGSGVRFAVPDTWTVNDPAKVLAQGDKAAIAKVAEALGVPADQFEAAAQSIELFVMGPPKDGFSPNVNVTPNSMASMPSAAALASEMQTIGATTGTARTVKTALGEAVVLPYTLPLGAYTVEGRAIVAETPKGFVTITVSHTSGDEADALTEQVLSSLGTI